MELNVQDWKEFRLNKVFTLKGGFYNKKPEHSEAGTIPFLASTESNNGVTEYYSLNDINSWDKVGEPDNTLENKLFSGNCIAVTVNGSVCNAFYQKTQFTCSHDITQLCLRYYTMNEYIGQFLCVIIMMDKYRWNYGRKPHDVKKFGMSIIKLPIQYNEDNTPVMDENRIYSEEGYIPDWQFMEDYIKSLHHKPITTKIKNNDIPKLNVQNWKEFIVGKIFRLEPTKGVVSDDLVEGKDIPYIGAKHDTNGYMMTCKKEDFEDWISEGNCIVFIQLGAGSAGYVNYLPTEFIGMNGKTICGYIDGVMNQYIGMFLETILCQERPKYSFGRSWTGDRLKGTKILLPVKCDISGKPLFDENKTYSDEGYIPDWQFMEDYIKLLPYSDRIV